jgi:hypothetical protein
MATIAFGMGIDRPDVRFLAHFDFDRPDTPEVLPKELVGRKSQAQASFGVEIFDRCENFFKKIANSGDTHHCTKVGIG